MEYLIAAALAFFLITIGLLLVLVLRGPGGASSGLEQRLHLIEKSLERMENSLREEMARNRHEFTQSAKQGREESSSALKNFGDSIERRLNQMGQSNETRLERMRATVEERLKQLQDDNSKKLDQMRATVDEKLQSTLEKRLGESFRVVSDRLEMVYRGLGEMRGLASDVGDLKKVLSNVKSRGTWGEIQLGNLLEQVLAPEQYAANVATRKGGRERVEFAIRLPGRGGAEEETVWLPIDAKFPQEDYQRLLEAQEKEAQRIGHDLHDIVGSSLTVLKLAIHEARKKLPEEQKGILDQIDELTISLAQDVRSLSHSLRSAEVEKIGLEEALLAYIDNLRNQIGIKIGLQYDELPEQIPNTTRITAFRIIQEALNNVVKHAGAQQATVTLRRSSENLVVSVEDTGRGFDTTQPPPDAGGLSGMRDRAVLSGGTLEIESDPGKGTRISAILPLQ